jgi:hypothetical protein
MDDVIPEAKPIHRSRAKVFDKNVGFLQKLQTQLDAFRPFEIDRNGIFPAILTEKVGRLIARERRPPLSPDIAARGRFYFVNAGPEIAEDQRAVGTSESVRKIEDPQTLQSRTPLT